MRARPAVSVVVPFFGEPAEAVAVPDRLESLTLSPSDELLLVDNTSTGVLSQLGKRGSGARVIAAPAQQSSYFARNVGAEHASREWLLFLDCDVVPIPDLLDAYFDEEPDRRCGAIAGGVVSAPGQTTLSARYARSRGHVSERFQIETGPRPAGITGNLLVRRTAWEAIGGFQERIRSGGDIEFCWRLQDAGWELVHRPRAEVAHLHPEHLAAMLRQSSRHGSGRAWVNRRYKGTMPRPALARPLGRCAIGVVAWGLTLRLERALFKAIDALCLGAEAWGYLAGSNTAGDRPGRPRSGGGPRPVPPVLALNDIFPAVTETFVYNEIRELRQLGVALRVEAAARPSLPDRAVGREIETVYLEDDPIAAKLASLLMLFLRHPLRCLRDLRGRRRWRTEEDVFPLRSLALPARRLARGGERHIHVNFASGAALIAMRLGALAGVTYSISTHGYDLFKSPRNLREKVERAAFATSASEYTSRYLRGAVGDAAALRVHKLIMGVDGERFRRESAYPGGRRVVAIGRYVEKKGFRHLVEAAAELAPAGAVDSVTIAGDGPLRAELEALAGRLGVGEVVSFPRALGPDAVRAQLERADLMVMPCVVAGDGDRDSMPVVVKEAMAMELPIVASDEVGLPEMIEPGWGILVPPGDSQRLAAAIAELLAMPAGRRREMGSAGRAWVLEHGSLHREAERLLELITAAAGDRGAQTSRASDRPAQ